MTVLFGTTPGGDDLGRTRVRKAAGSSTLYIQVSSQGTRDGEVNLQDNAYISCLDDYRVWYVPPSTTGSGRTFYMDTDRDWSTYGKLYPVLVGNVGPAIGGFINAGTGLLTVALNFSTSYAAEPGASMSSYAYTLPGSASVTSGATNTHTVTFTVPAGRHRVKLVGTDSNGRATVRQILVVALEKSGTYVPTPLSFDSFRLVHNLDSRLEFRTLRALPKGTYPDGTLIVVVREAKAGSADGNLAGVSGLEPLAFVGWHDTEDVTHAQTEKGTENETTLRFISVLGRCKQLRAPQTTYERDVGTTRWGHLKGANVDRLLLANLQQYSTVPTVADIQVSGTGDTYAFSSWSTRGGTLYEQGDNIARSAGGIYRWTCDPIGRTLMRPDPLLQDTGDRTGTIIVDIDETDWAGELKYVGNRAPRLGVMTANAVLTSTVDADDVTKEQRVYTMAPGDGGGQGEGQANAADMLHASQATVNSWVGHAYARENAPEGLFSATLAHGLDAGIYPCLMEPVRLTISSTYAAQRGLAFTDGYFLPNETILDHDADTGVQTQTVALERYTVGSPGKAQAPPPAVTNDLPTIPPFDVTFPPFPTFEIPDFSIPAVQLYVGTQRIALIAANGIAYTPNFGSGSGTLWSYVTYATLSISGTVLQWVPNGFEPGSGWIVTSTGVYYGALPTGAFTLKHTFATASSLRSADASFGSANHFVVCSYYGASGGVKALYTTDNSTFTEVTVSSHYESSAVTAPLPGCYVSPKTAGLVYTTAFTSTAAGGANSPPGACYRSTDYGATWATTTTPLMTAADVRLAQHIHVPYAGAETTAFFARADNTSGTTAARLARAVGSTVTDVSPVISATTYTLTYSRQILETFVGNANRAYGCLQASGGGSFAVFRSDNALAGTVSWTTLVAPGTDFRRCAVAGDNGDTLYLWGANQSVSFSVDAGVTIVSQQGDLATYLTGDLTGLAGY